MVFEKAGNLRPGYHPVEFTHRFWIAPNLGEVDFANDDVAVAIDEKKFELVIAIAGPVEVVDGSGKVIASGASSVHQPIVGEFDGNALIVRREGKVLLEQSLPDA